MKACPQRRVSGGQSEQEKVYRQGSRSRPRRGLRRRKAAKSRVETPRVPRCGKRQPLQSRCSPPPEAPFFLRGCISSTGVNAALPHSLAGGFRLRFPACPAARAPRPPRRHGEQAAAIFLRRRIQPRQRGRGAPAALPGTAAARRAPAAGEPSEPRRERAKLGPGLALTHFVRQPVRHADGAAATGGGGGSGGLERALSRGGAAACVGRGALGPGRCEREGGSPRPSPASPAAPGPPPPRPERSPEPSGAWAVPRGCPPSPLAVPQELQRPHLPP